MASAISRSCRRQWMCEPRPPASWPNTRIPTGTPPTRRNIPASRLRSMFPSTGSRKETSAPSPYTKSTNRNRTPSVTGPPSVSAGNTISSPINIPRTTRFVLVGSRRRVSMNRSRFVVRSAKAIPIRTSCSPKANSRLFARSMFVKKLSQKFSWVGALSGMKRAS